MSWSRTGSNPRGAAARARLVGVVEGSLGAADRYASLTAQLPEIRFETVSSDWRPGEGPTYDVLIVAMRASEAEPACQWLRALPSRTQAIVVLHDADVATTRKLMRDGAAADVLPAPVSAPAVASALDRVFTAAAAAPQAQGAVVTVMKAGGGVGATTLAAQLAAMLARRGRSVCLADLDLQGGLATTYLDIAEAISVIDVLGAGAELADAPFASALATHASGLRLLAAPTESTPVEALTAASIEALLAGLKRAFGLTIIDLPATWCSWTSEVVRASDHVLMLTQLSVPHMQHLKRQLKMLSLYHLDAVPLSLICNAVRPEQLASLSIKAAERTLGRSFDAVLPDDGKLMASAVNQGVELAVVRRGTKLEKALAKLAENIGARVDQRVA